MSSLNSINVSEATKNMAEIVLNHAKEQREAILREAKRRVTELIDNAKREAEERKAKLVEQGKKELDKLKEREIVKIKMEYKKKLYAYKWSIVNTLISQSLSILEKVREQKDEYREYLLTSITSAFNLINENEIIVHVDKRDAELVEEITRNLKERRKIRVLPDITTVGGLVVTSRDGLKEINTTIETKLKLKNQALKEKLYNFLFGDLDVRS
jgi:vacuolar-type H+-ATPase subunit E/Vma4